MNILPFDLALMFYLAAAVAGIIELIRSSKAVSRLMLLAAAAGFVVHTISIVHRYAVAGHMPITSPHEATSFFAWCIVLLFFVMEFRYSVGLLGSFIMPLVFVMMMASSLLSRDFKVLTPPLQSYWLGIHTLLAFMANAAFALAMVTGVMYLVQEHYLKSKHLGDLFTRLPSIQTLDYLNYRLVTFGFPALLMAMVTGALWGNSVYGSYWRWDPREVFSLVTLLIYATIVHARLMAGWRGRKAAVLSIIGFIVIIAAFAGIKILQKGYHVF